MVINAFLRIGYEDGREMELVQDRIRGGFSINSVGYSVSATRVTKGASRLLVLHLVSVSKSGRFHENEPKQRDQPQPWLESLATPATVTLRL